MSETVDLVRRALAEDLGPGDWTSLWTVPAGRLARGAIVAKEPGVAAGVEPATLAFGLVDPALELVWEVKDGDQVARGDRLLVLNGPARGVLSAERTALNFLQQLSGVATLARRYVDAVAGTGARIIDTRKTVPGLRHLQKAAVRAGGAANHRHGLHDMVLIKENHIRAAGGISAAVERVREHNHAGLRVEVETTSLLEVGEALAARVSRIMFDNMPVPLLREAVARVRSAGPERPETEASGGVNLHTVRAVAETEVDLISVGALTHSAPALDLSLLVDAD